MKKSIKNLKCHKKNRFTQHKNDLTKVSSRSWELLSYFNLEKKKKSWKMLHAECVFFIERNKKSQNSFEEVFRPQVSCFVGAMGELVGIFFYYSKIKILIRKKTTIFNFSVLSDHKRADQRRMSVECSTHNHPCVQHIHFYIFLFSHDHWRFSCFSHFFYSFDCMHRSRLSWMPHHNRTKNSLFSKYFLIWAFRQATKTVHRSRFHLGGKINTSCACAKLKSTLFCEWNEVVS